MKRSLSLVLAAALVAGTMAVSVAPASAQGAGVTFGVGNWNNDRWHYDDNGWRHRHRDHFAPGFSFQFGVPYPHARAYYRPTYRERDCWRDWDGALICRY